MADSAEKNNKPSSRVPKPLRAVTPSSRSHRDGTMDIFGWGILAGLLVLIVPLLPFLIIVWAISKVTEALTPS